MDFLSDYWAYCSCYEIPRNYALWSALSVISSTINRRVVFLHGDIEMTGILYVGLIGAPGNSKSTCCYFAKDFFERANPGAKIGPSRTSPEMLVKLMSEDGVARAYTNHLGELDEIRPYSLFINEFQNFLGRSPFDMIALITDIFDCPFYDGSTLARGVELIRKPALTILMCAPPDWFIENIKGTLISGGLARRFVLVYESYGEEPKPDIVITTEAVEAKKRIVQRLCDAKQLCGAYRWGTGHSAYDKWYRENFDRRRKENNKIMQGYLKSKNTHLYKVMMLLDLVSDKPMFVFSKELVETGLALLDSVEANMPKLSAAAGRNTLMGPQQRLLEILKQAGGWMPKKQLMRDIETELTPQEISSVFHYLEQSEQIVQRFWEVPNELGTKVRREIVAFPARYAEMIKNGEVKISTSQPPQP